MRHPKRCSVTVPIPNPRPFPMPMPIPPYPASTLTSSCQYTPLPPPSPPSTLTRLEKQAAKAGRKIVRSESESTGEVDGQLGGEVSGPINMTKPWVEGPKSSKVSDPRLFPFHLLTSCSTKNYRLGMGKLDRPASYIVTIRRLLPPRPRSLGNPRGFPRLSAKPVPADVTPACGL